MPKNKPPAKTGGLAYGAKRYRVVSALGELRRATGGLQTVLLALLHSGVAGQQTGLLQNGTHLIAVLQQGAGDAVTDSAGLAGNAAASDGAAARRQEDYRLGSAADGALGAEGSAEEDFRHGHREAAQGISLHLRDLPPLSGLAAGDFFRVSRDFHINIAFSCRGFRVCGRETLCMISTNLCENQIPEKIRKKINFF